jgi:uncharacterized protein YutE (UPF0331/DUF86 family)
MTAIEPVIVLNKLDFMTNYLDNLKRFESVTLEEYLDDYNQQLAVERLLQLIIQVAIDINRYFLKQLELEQPATNFETFIEVSRRGIITMELAEKLAPSGSLRNRLVHMYEEIDPVKVYEAIQKALQNYRVYQRQVIIYLDSLEATNG